MGNSGIDLSMISQIEFEPFATSYDSDTATHIDSVH